MRWAYRFPLLLVNIMKNMSPESFRQLALSFPGTEENPHFDRRAFKITGKRIFATLHEKSISINLKLPQVDQKEYCALDENAIYPVPNKWGKQGWTFVKLDKIKKDMLIDILTTAYCEVAAKKLSRKFQKLTM